jgi:hypothetical protein
MTATLFAELEEEAAVGLVADIVRGVLDESSPDQPAALGRACHLRSGPQSTLE